MSSNAGSAGANLGAKVKGAWNTFEGMGDTLRGGAMDFVDSATGTGPSRHPETDIGAQKTETGINQMESRATNTSGSTNATTGTTAGTCSTAGATGPTV